MRLLLWVITVVFSFMLGMVAEAQYVFPVIEARVRAEGYTAGVKAQADEICHTVYNLSHSILGNNGFLIACDNGVPPIERPNFH